MRNLLLLGTMLGMLAGVTPAQAGPSVAIGIGLPGFSMHVGAGVSLWTPGVYFGTSFGFWAPRAYAPPVAERPALPTAPPAKGNGTVPFTNYQGPYPSYIAPPYTP